MSTGTRDDPWQLSPPPGSSQYTMYRDDEGDLAELTHDKRNNRMRAR